MGTSLVKLANDNKKLTFQEKLSDMFITTTDQKNQAIIRIFKKQTQINISDLIYTICILIYELKKIMVYDYHQKRIVQSFYNKLNNLPEKLKEPLKSKLLLELIPLEMNISIEIARFMIDIWWNEPNEQKNIFQIPVSLILIVKKINPKVKDQKLILGSKLIVYGGQPLDLDYDKEKEYLVTFGRISKDITPQIPFSNEEGYISKKHCIIDYKKPTSFYLIDYSIHLNTCFRVKDTPYLLKKGLVIELGHYNRFYIESINPVIDKKEEDPFLEIKYLNIKEEQILNNRENYINIQFFVGILKNYLFIFDDKNIITIGRSKLNSIQIKDKKISKFHCQIRFLKDIGWILEDKNKLKTNPLDLESSGTFILAKNFEEIKEKKDSKEIKLENNMIINIGINEFLTDIE